MFRAPPSPLPRRRLFDGEPPTASVPSPRPGALLFEPGDMGAPPTAPLGSLAGERQAAGEAAPLVDATDGVASDIVLVLQTEK